MKLKVIVVALCCVVFNSSWLLAWNNVGHMLVAKIAFDQLTGPQRQAAVDILRAHPHYQRYLRTDRPDEISECEWCFLRAATWPDWVRVPKDFPREEIASHWRYKFHRPTWHYVNYAYEAGQTDLELTAPLNEDETHILKILPMILETVRGNSTDEIDLPEGLTPEQQKAVSLCWLLHLIGDLHQPLHVAALVNNSRFQRGDHGGNYLAVRAEAGSEPVRLHSFWDDLLGDEFEASEFQATINRLNSDPDLEHSKLSELQRDKIDFVAWAKESYEEAAKTAYLAGELPTIEWRDKERWTESYLERVPTLSKSQLTAAEGVARRRVVVAGNRLLLVLQQQILPK